MQKAGVVKQSLRRMVGFALHALPEGKISDLILWPLSHRLFATYAEVVRVDPLFRMRLYGDMDDMVNKSLLFTSGRRRLSWEPVTARLVEFLSPQVRTAVVAGSHLGYYPLIIAANNPGAAIYAFEPNPSNYERFVSNISLNGFSNIRPEQQALGSKEGEQRMYFDFGQSSFLDSTRKHAGEGTVKVSTLDGFFEAAPLFSLGLDLMVLDAEGYELYILQGAMATIKKSLPDIVFEVNPKTLEAAGSNDHELRRALADLGYSIFLIVDDYKHPIGDTSDRPIRLAPFSSSSIEGMPFVNAFATVSPAKIGPYL